MNNTKAVMAAFLSFLVPMLASYSNPLLASSETTYVMNPDKARVIEYWTKQRIVESIPRDLVMDQRGLGYLRKPDGTLTPYGQYMAADEFTQQVTPFARPPGAGDGDAVDSTPPVISSMIPGAGQTIGASHTFSATVTDESGIKSVSFVIQYPNGSTTQSFNASKEANSDTWSATLQGFTDGNWGWWVVAKDGAGKGGNSTTSNTVNFSVDTNGTGGGSGGGDTDTITNATWVAGGAVQTAAGRIYFEMPANSKRKGPWNGYVCSGTVVEDETTNRSIILTAAHCIYDDANKAFARNVLFIPDQAGTSGSGTDLECSNDPLGCWTPSFGVVDINWTNATFPDNIPWDYGYYVVSDMGAHAGSASISEALDAATGTLPVSFLDPFVDDGVAGKDSVDFTNAIGYSYNDDPNLMYCAEDMTTEGVDNWWLPSCGLSGGSSGGPWVQPMDISLGSGPVISVNSWGYTTAPGMAGPKLVNSSAECLFNIARSTDWQSILTADGEEGISVECP